MNRALIVVDVQNDFVTGSLAVPGALDIIPVINSLVKEFDEANELVVYTLDWHVNNHSSFVGHGGFWPRHCVMYTEGAEHPANLLLARNKRRMAKAIESECYSGFEVDDHEHCGLDNVLRVNGVRLLTIVGLATDYCVRHTVLDARRFGYEVEVIQAGCAAVSKEDGEQAIEDMIDAGACIL